MPQKWNPYWRRELLETLVHRMMGTLLQGPLEVSQGRREQVAASTHVAVRKPLPCVGIS